MPQKKLEEKSVYQVLAELQAKIKVPKSKFNQFGNFYYRSLEDIFEEVKKYQQELGFTLVVADDIVVVENRIYIKATASFIYNGQKIEVSAFAREPDLKKGMDVAQITGSASSYARKYALSGLLLLDDNKDVDEEQPEQPQPPTNNHNKPQNNKDKEQYEPEFDKKKFIESVNNLIKEKGLPDKLVKMTLQLSGINSLEDINNREIAVEVYKNIMKAKVEKIKDEEG